MAVLYRWNELVLASTLKLLGNDVKGHATTLCTNDGGQSHQDFFMFGSRDDPPASIAHLDNLSS